MNVELTEDQKIKVQNSAALYRIMREILMREDSIERDHEHCWVVCLASNNKILNIELVSLGSINEALIQPMQVFRFALIKGAVKLIMVHNHPDGELRPSEADEDVTDRMIQVGNIVEVEVLDHMIITEKFYYSFKDDGLMEELSQSTKFVPTFIEIDRIKKEALKLGEKRGLKAGKKIGMEKGLEKGIKKGRKEGEKIGVEKGRKEGKKEGEKSKAIKIARKSLKEGISVELISKISGLSKEEIEAL